MFSAIVEKIVRLDYKIHLIIGLFVRYCLIIYGNYHDEHSTVLYTDIDYKVFTDAARYVINNQSPYLRYTYRYTPLVAILLIPNILITPNFGKILFSIFDIIDAILIRLIVRENLIKYNRYNDENFDKKITNRKKPKRSIKSCSNSNENIIDNIERYCNISLLFWLYNPLIITIATRGNCDSIAVFFVLLTLYLLQCKQCYFLTGIVHGISIHFRLYPIIYSLSYFMYLSEFSFYTTDRREFNDNQAITEPTEQIIDNSTNQIANPNNKKIRKTIFKIEYCWYVIPNINQLLLISGCLLSLIGLTVTFYLFYGYQFLYETYIYHFVRQDVRHNFSVYFYLQYLTAWIKNIGIWQKVLIQLPKLILILVFSIRYGLNQFSLNFSILTQTIVFVIFNTVITSQYFIWFLAILPLCLWQINMTMRNALFLLFIWIVAQITWLLPAYFLEFHGQNTFLFIWIQSVSFFCANIAILGRFIMNFMPLKTKLD